METAQIQVVFRGCLAVTVSAMVVSALLEALATGGHLPMGQLYLPGAGVWDTIPVALAGTVTSRKTGSVCAV